MIHNCAEITHFGILIVLGVFDNSEDHVVYGMRQIGVNPIQKYLITRRNR